MIKRAVGGVMRALAPARFRPRVKAAAIRVRYMGWRYRCPFCGSRMRRYRPFGLDVPVLREKQVVGGGHRQNAQCPNCGSLDRERLLYLFLKYRTPLFATPHRLLHVAPEPRVAARLRADAGIDYLTADIEAPGVMVHMDITRIPCPDRGFDAIVCNHVLEHIIDDAKAMAELHRVLKPGGWAVLQVPIALALRETYEDFSIIAPLAREEAFGQDDHVRLYARDYRDRLARAGFGVDVFSWVDAGPEFGRKRNVFALNEDERVYCAVEA